MIGLYKSSNRLFSIVKTVEEEVEGEEKEGKEEEWEKRKNKKNRTRTI